MSDARARALAALDIIDSDDLLLGTHSHGAIVAARKDRAYTALAAAMNDLYGPLHDDHQDDIGSELADREDRL